MKYSISVKSETKYYQSKGPVIKENRKLRYETKCMRLKLKISRKKQLFPRDIPKQSQYAIEKT
jgi:hypothetical protein